MFRNQAALAGDRRAKALAESRETLPAARFERAAHSWCDVESSAACRKRTKIGEKVGAAGRIRQEPLGPNCRRASATASAKSREAQSVARFGRKSHSRQERKISEVCVRNVRQSATARLTRAVVAQNEESCADFRPARIWSKSRRSFQAFRLFCVSRS